ncbi:MAG TPA: hypothetical protein VMG08_03045 [Allosphingosinicella sp.]|nr:hypothetical protein [Allosphingosinicella sp.]
MRLDKRVLFIVPAVAALSAPLLVASGGEAEAAQAAGAVRGSLCAQGEVVLFHCGVGRKMVSVCGSNRGPARAEYRYGAPGDLELAYPAPGQTPLTYAREIYSGGGAQQIRFTNGGYDYAVYSRTVRTGFGRGGNNPRVSDGLMVRRGDRLVSNRSCTTPVRSEGQIEDYMREGTILDWAD